MPFFLASALSQRKQRMRRRPGDASGTAPAGTSGALNALGWGAALVAIFGAFLGGAGLFMIAAGHLIASTLALAGVGAVSLVYLVWFLARGPGSGSPTERLPSTRPSRPRPVDTTVTDSARCTSCGIVEHDANRVIATGTSAICERCIASAMPKLSPYWATRGGLPRS